MPYPFTPARRRLAPLALACIACVASAGAVAQEVAASKPLDMATIMADPDWIGNSVEQAWWSWDGRELLYTRKREGASIRDLGRTVAGHEGLVPVLLPVGDGLLCAKKEWLPDPD